MSENKAAPNYDRIIEEREMKLRRIADELNLTQDKLKQAEFRIQQQAEAIKFFEGQVRTFEFCWRGGCYDEGKERKA